MEIIINLTHDTVLYEKEGEYKYGTLKQSLFGVKDFSIREGVNGCTIEFKKDWEDEETVQTCPCEFTDDGLRLVVTIK